MNRHSFLRGAMILATAGLISRIIGAIFRIPLTRLIGPEGIGLFEMAYPVYGLMLVVSTAGIPVAISKLVAEKAVEGDRDGVRRIMRIAFLILFVTGVIGAVLLYWSAAFLAHHFLGDSRSYYSIIAIAPAVFFVALMSSFRGFFQGLQVMTPTALSQVVEQMVRAVTMLLLAYFLLPLGLPVAAAGAAFGATTGGICGLLVLVIIYWRRNWFLLTAIPRRQCRPEGICSVMGRIVKLSAPVTFGSLAKPAMHIINAVIVPVRLQVAGYTVMAATSLYGQLVGMALVLTEFPTIFTTAIATSLVPAISEAVAMGNYALVRSRAYQGIRITFMFALPAFVGLFILAKPIMAMLFDCPEAGIPLAYVSFGLVFICLSETAAGILNGIGKTSMPARNLLIGVICDMIISYNLTAMPAFGIKGAAIGTACGYMVAAMLNLGCLFYFIGSLQGIGGAMIRPMLAVLVMGYSVQQAYLATFTAAGSNTLATISAIFAGMFVYGLVLLLIGGIKEKDLELFPLFGQRILIICKKLRLVRR